MKIPVWFVIGCGLLVLNLVLVLGGSLSRHASATPPDDQEQVDSKTEAESQSAAELPTLPDAGSLPPTLIDESKVGLPTVPSLESPSLESPSLGNPRVKPWAFRAKRCKS